jgi:hydrogenase maturation protease
LKGEPEVQCLILGIGNLLMGDEGVGVHAVRALSGRPLPPGVECLDGGTGGLHLLEPVTRARRIVLIDATADGAPVGTVRRLRPKFSSDYPRTLTAHDIGLKDLLDAAFLTGRDLDVTLFAVSIEPPGEMSLALSPPVAALLPGLVEQVLEVARAESEPPLPPDQR